MRYMILVWSLSATCSSALHLEGTRFESVTMDVAKRTALTDGRLVTNDVGKSYRPLPPSAALCRPLPPRSHKCMCVRLPFS